jgi:hypothetical protein
VTSGYRHGHVSSWARFWAGKPLPPCPPGLPPAWYAEFRRHVRDEVPIATLIRETGEAKHVVRSRLDRTHRALHRPRRCPPEGEG